MQKQNLIAASLERNRREELKQKVIRSHPLWATISTMMENIEELSLEQVKKLYDDVVELQKDVSKEMSISPYSSIIYDVAKRVQTQLVVCKEEQ